MKILVLEDDMAIAQAIAIVMREEGFEVSVCHKGEDGLNLIINGLFDLIILDVMLPELDGFTIIQETRRGKVDTPILCLTAKDGLNDRVKGLSIGADDYLLKPFEMPELIARVKVLLRRSLKMDFEELLCCGDISIQVKRRCVNVLDELLLLTEKEFMLLEYLIVNKDRICTKDQILNRVWGLDSDTGIGIVDLYIHYLRKKLSVHHVDHYILTVRGLGFMIQAK